MTRKTRPLADLGSLGLAALGSACRISMKEEMTAWDSRNLGPCIAALRKCPGPSDADLVRLCDTMRLCDAELLLLALLIRIESEAEAARAIAELQHPLASTRLLLGFAASALKPVGLGITDIAFGPAVRSGAILLGDEAAALPERSLSAPLPLIAALAGHVDDWESVKLVSVPEIPLPQDIEEEAARRAKTLLELTGAGLVIRSPSPSEARAVAGRVANNLGRRLARVEGAPPAALASWLIAAKAVAFFEASLGPGETWAFPELGSYHGPWLASLGVDGSIQSDHMPDDWVLPIPDVSARQSLWQKAGLKRADAARAATSFRQGAGRIAEAARRARYHAQRRGSKDLQWEDLTNGVSGSASALDALAQRSHGTAPDAALVFPSALNDALTQLVERARLRSVLADGLGPTLEARYRPGVRALFTGESGTGKTLAAYWLSGQLGLPLYKVDMSALTSKWIGETEKNLSTVLNAAEHADALLFFDEADSLFGARTDVGDAHDRFANAQTNFLLQRIEEFDGIALLASNSRDRFDPAFARRLDVILEFPMPEPPARRLLWDKHLGDGHSLSAPELDHLALAVDLAGGHIRNIVLSAAARARVAKRAINLSDINAAAMEEYAKLGRQPPGLSR